MRALGANEILGPRVGDGWQKAVSLASQAIAVPQDPGFAYDARSLGVTGVAGNQRRVVPKIGQSIVELHLIWHLDKVGSIRNYWAGQAAPGSFVVVAVIELVFLDGYGNGLKLAQPDREADSSNHRRAPREPFGKLPTQVCR